ncbi:hypothetical protein UlMin_022272 [Ulmus minor]
MKGTSKVIMGATLVMVVSLAMVLGLILVLLAELYCSLLLRRRQLRISHPDTATPTATTVPETANSSSSPAPSSQPQNHSSGVPPPPPPPPPPFTSFYSHGVLSAPRSLLFPSISSKEDTIETKKMLQSQLHHQVIDISNQESNTSPSISLATSPQPARVDKREDGNNGKGEHFVYICNPIYDGSRVSGANTPFETPDSSPSRLEMADSGSGSGSEDEIAKPSSPSSPTTPPLTPMKKLPAEASSVSLRNARSLGTSGSDSNTNNGLSSSSSGSPCTSPSW